MAPKKRPWFRFYVEACTDRKLRRLTPEQRWLWTTMMAASRMSPHPGWLYVTEDEPMDVHDLADLAAMPLRRVEAGLEAIASQGIAAFDPELDCWYLPKWAARQFESDESAKRVAAFRQAARCNDDVTAYRAENVPDVTHQRQRQNSETDITPLTPLAVDTERNPAQSQADQRVVVELDVRRSSA